MPATTEPIDSITKALLSKMKIIGYEIKSMPNRRSTVGENNPPSSLFDLPVIKRYIIRKQNKPTGRNIIAE
jgi:hypothetical protein